MKIKWKEAAPLPIGRSAHTAVLLHGSVYVGGGFEGIASAKRRDCYRLDVYNITTNQWSASPIITPCCWFGMTVLDDKLIIAGGDKNDIPTNKVHILYHGEWKYYSTMPTARTSLFAVGYHSMLITVGGQVLVNGKWTRLATTELLDTTNGCWYTCNDLPVPYLQLKGEVINKTLYLLGGKGTIPSPQVFTASLDNLSSHQLKWQSFPDTPWCHSAPVVLYNKFLLTVGGRQPSDVISQTSEVWGFNPSSWAWQQVANVPSAVTFPGIVKFSDDAFVMMGGSNNQREYTCDTYIGQWTVL